MSFPLTGDIFPVKQPFVFLVLLANAHYSNENYLFRNPLTLIYTFLYKWTSYLYRLIKKGVLLRY